MQTNTHVGQRLKQKRKVVSNTIKTTLTKLNKNEIVALTVLIKICKALDCQIEDVVEISDEAI